MDNHPCRTELSETWYPYPGVENYYFPCQDYSDDSSDEGFDYCTKCMEDLEQGRPVDLGIRSERIIHDDGTRGVQWVRVPIHVWCLPSYLSYRSTMARDHGKQHHLVVSRSSQVLLLLEELGLPRDVAWPIVAVAYWLL